MVSTKGVLSLRTLSKNGSVRRAPIPFHPGLLAGLISWGSSPHASKQGEWLIAAQMNWSSAYENAETADVPFRRSMQFLRGVLEQFPNDTWVHRTVYSYEECWGISMKSESARCPQCSVQNPWCWKELHNAIRFVFIRENTTETYRSVIPLPSLSSHFFRM